MIRRQRHYTLVVVLAEQIARRQYVLDFLWLLLLRHAERLAELGGAVVTCLDEHDAERAGLLEQVEDLERDAAHLVARRLDLQRLRRHDVVDGRRQAEDERRADAAAVTSTDEHHARLGRP